jgi:hypothetical protein
MHQREPSNHSNTSLFLYLLVFIVLLCSTQAIKFSCEQTPFELLYGQEVVLPMEIGLQSLRVTEQGSLSAKEYHKLMMDKIDDIPESRFRVLEEIEKEKVKIAKAYNKRVVKISFQVGDLVWKTILPLGTQSGKFGK